MTNGEKIRKIFPNLEWIFNAESEYYKTYIDGIHRHCFDSDWWHSEYEEPISNIYSDDCISREQAIREADYLSLETSYDNQKVIEMLETLPPATPIRPKGHWILGGYDDYYYICDKCNYKASEYYFKPRYNYCPNCGARMVEPQEREEK